MRNGPAPVPLALLTLPGHAPAPARVELVRVPLARRLLLAGGSGALFWGLAVVLLVLPPHYPYFLLGMALGVYLPYVYWTGRWRVRAFAGSCPRCGRHLQLPHGTRVDLPHTLTCFACHFEPRLELEEAPREPGVRHRSAECVGRWELCWLADECFVVCDSCRAHFPATPETQREAREENARGSLLAQLTNEGGFFT